MIRRYVSGYALYCAPSHPLTLSGLSQQRQARDKNTDAPSRQYLLQSILTRGGLSIYRFLRWSSPPLPPPPYPLPLFLLFLILSSPSLLFRVSIVDVYPFSLSSRLSLSSPFIFSPPLPSLSIFSLFHFFQEMDASAFFSESIVANQKRR